MMLEEEDPLPDELSQDEEQPLPLVRVLRFRDAIVDREEELVDLLSRETGKPLVEALLHEVGMAGERISEIVGAVKTYVYLDQAPVQRVNVAGDGMLLPGQGGEQ